MGLEEQAQVEQRSGEQAPVPKQQGDEQSTEPAVAVEIGMQRLELYMQEPHSDERREVALVVDGALEVAEQPGSSGPAYQRRRLLCIGRTSVARPRTTTRAPTRTTSGCGAGASRRVEGDVEELRTDGSAGPGELLRFGPPLE